MPQPEVDAAAPRSATFLLAAASETPRRWLQRALAPLGVVHGIETAHGARESVAQRIGAANPDIVFLYFCAEDAAAATALGQQLTRLHPHLPLVALADAQDPALMLAALRAGVKDYLDLGSSGAAALATVQRLLAARQASQPSRRGQVVVTLGARPGVGATTLATNLAVAARQTNGREVLLLDLGLPARDAALHLNLVPGFDFVEAVRNLRRFDQVFVQTALSRHASGVAVLPLPATLAELRDIAFSDALTLIGTLRSHFDLQIIDLGGFSNVDVMAQLATVADDVLLVVEQSVAATVSAAELVEELGRREIDRSRLGLVVSRFLPGLDLDAGQIAERLQLSLAATLPDSRQALLTALNSGKTLAETHPAAPYVRGLAPLLARAGCTEGPTPTAQNWLKRIRHALRGWRTGAWQGRAGILRASGTASDNKATH